MESRTQSNGWGKSPAKRRKFSGTNIENGGGCNYDHPTRGQQPSCTHLDRFQRKRKFLPIRGNSGVFHSEKFKGKETLYMPLREDVLLNTRNVEQFSFSEGTFFLGDESSRYVSSAQGYAIHIWRYNDSLQQLFVSRSLLFTNSEAYQEIRSITDVL